MAATLKRQTSRGLILDDARDWVIMINTTSITPARIDMVQQMHQILSEHGIGPKQVAELRLYNGWEHDLPELVALIPGKTLANWPFVIHCGHLIGNTADELRKYLVHTYPIHQHRHQSSSSATTAEAPADSVDTHTKLTPLREALQRQMAASQPPQQSLFKGVLDTIAGWFDSAAAPPAPPDQQLSLAKTNGDGVKTVPLQHFCDQPPTAAAGTDAARAVPALSRVDGASFTVLRTSAGWHQAERSIVVGQQCFQRVDPATDQVRQQFAYESVARLRLTDNDMFLQISFDAAEPESYIGSNVKALAEAIVQQAHLIGKDLHIDRE